MNQEASSLVLMEGNNAIAWGAVAAGVDYLAHYPGSPVNRVDACLRKISEQHDYNVFINNSLNEHVAALCAGGASYMGARSMLVMKHVGLNIAADPLSYLAQSGVKGGLVVVVGTDPGAHSSTGEQDVHWYAKMLKIPLLEPCSTEQILEYTVRAFEISERYEIPVFLHVANEICQNSAMIEPPKIVRSLKEFYFEKSIERYVNVGKSAVANNRKLHQKIKNIAAAESAQRSMYNQQAKTLVITRGICFLHAAECIDDLGLADRVHLLNLELTYPLADHIARDAIKGIEQLIIVEDQDGFLEDQIKAQFFEDLSGKKIFGKSHFPTWGGINLEQVRQGLCEIFEIPRSSTARSAIEVPERLGTYCEGCPHRGSFYAIDEALKDQDGIIGGDIGCSSLPPQRADWLLCMNAGIGISQGMAQLNNSQSIISTGGDGSFFHAGLISLLNAVVNRIELLHVVFDNRAIAMTGHQASPSDLDDIDIETMIRAMGVNYFIAADAFEPRKLQETLKMAQNLPGVKVVWVSGRCALTPDPELIERRRTRTIEIENEKCESCSLCYDTLQCPAIKKTINDQLKVDLDRCMRCGLCIEVCPNDAIKISEGLGA
jgi:indolepyruvate ferredoxin oxidoreductase, alpha subunit